MFTNSNFAKTQKAIAGEFTGKSNQGLRKKLMASAVENANTYDSDQPYTFNFVLVAKKVAFANTETAIESLNKIQKVYEQELQEALS